MEPHDNFPPSSTPVGVPIPLVNEDAAPTKRFQRKAPSGPGATFTTSDFVVEPELPEAHNPLNRPAHALSGWYASAKGGV